jgi:hypothetical protein
MKTSVNTGSIASPETQQFQGGGRLGRQGAVAEFVVAAWRLRFDDRLSARQPAASSLRTGASSASNGAAAQRSCSWNAIVG